MENKKFQIKTSGRIDSNSDIRWTIGGPGWFIFDAASIDCGKCNGGFEFSDQDKTTMGFFLRAGVFTFLKTSTQLQVWFDDVLEVTWEYEDNDEDNKCRMRTKMTGLMFRAPRLPDTVSTHYRYQMGKGLLLRLGLTLCLRAS